MPEPVLTPSAFIINEKTAHVPVDRRQGPGEPIPFVDLEDIPAPRRAQR